jgi:carboxyl-terminal processing protease
MVKKIVVVLLAVLFINTKAFNDKHNLQLEKNYEIFYELFKTLEIYYVDTIDYSAMLDKGLNAMLSTLDPYTNYIPAKDVESFDFQITGKYGGIGSVIRKIDSNVRIIEPYEGSPSQRAGLLPGDKILEVNGENMTNLPVGKVTDKLKGDPGEKLSIKIERYATKDTIIINLIRERISVPSVPYWGLIENSKTGYIILNSFRQNCSDTIAEAVKQLKKQGAESLILDLRNNPGGLLNEAVKICNIFIPSNKQVVSTKGKLSLMNTSYKTQLAPVDTIIPLLVMINSGSASASEIVSGTLQDYDRALILGQRSFGKGLVQTPKNLPHNTKMKFTSAKYYIPSGRCIQVLDYSHRKKDGSAGKIPDSLKTAFKTQAGRIVYDGGGIAPDVEAKQKILHDITLGLYAEDMVFNYANIFHFEHSSIGSAKEFKISEEEFNKFKQYLKDKKFIFKSKAQQSLENLKKNFEKDSIKGENYTSSYEILTKLIENQKDEKIEESQQEIKEFLEQEIIGRYFFQKGKIISRMKYDEVLKKAVEIINNQKEFTKHLVPEKDVKSVKKEEEKKDKKMTSVNTGSQIYIFV